MPLDPVEESVKKGRTQTTSPKRSHSMKLPRRPALRKTAMLLLHTFCVAIVAAGSFAEDLQKGSELQYPIPCYEGDALEEVRQWEEHWAGKKINKGNADQVKALIPEALYTIVKTPKKWGVGEIWFTIASYGQRPVSPGYVEATKKYSSSSKLGSEGHLIGWDTGELAGLPFPNPQKGIEMAWNYESVTHGDTHKFAHEMSMVKAGRTWLEREALQLHTHQYFTGRTDVPPLPRMVPNRKKLRRAVLFLMKKPLDVFGMAALTMRNLDPTKEDITYTWISLFRRLRRSPGTTRKESVPGGDLLREETFGWDAHVTRNEYRFIGREDILAARNQDVGALEREKGQVIFNGFQMERIKAYVVEATPKDPGYAYSKQVWYLDPEAWLMLYKVNWDQKGRMWRFGLFSNGVVEGSQGVALCYPVGENFIDMRSPHGSLTIRSRREFDAKVRDQYFTTENLKRVGH
jgi:hypothetical protein